MSANRFMKFQFAITHDKGIVKKGKHIIAASVGGTESGGSPVNAYGTMTAPSSSTTIYKASLAPELAAEWVQDTVLKKRGFLVQTTNAVTGTTAATYIARQRAAGR